MQCSCGASTEVKKIVREGKIVQVYDKCRSCGRVEFRNRAVIESQKEQSGSKC